MKRVLSIAFVLVTLLVTGGILALLPGGAGPADEPTPAVGNPTLGTRPGGVGRGTPLAASAGNALAIFGQGCFWGVEERFRRLEGVVATAVGYTGGKTGSPTYDEVSRGRSGHVEAVLVEFDPARVSYREMLRFFWETHDPTSGNRQGPDVGSQYRSAIYALDPAQLEEATRSRDEEQRRLADRITTEIALAGPFWVAEAEHQQWDEKHGRRSCPVPARPRRVAQ